MKSLRQTMALLLTFALAFSAAACGGNGTKSDSSDSFRDSSFSAGASSAGAGGSSESSDDDSEKKQAEVDEALSLLDDENFTIAQLCGTDALGRKVTPNVGSEEKYVGLFYFVATGHVYDNGDPMNEKIYDITKLIELYGSDKLTNPVMALSSGQTAKYYDPSISPEGKAHFWGEPLYGYYRSDDSWVVRKHLELFMNAGIDFLYLDYTNNIIYEEETKVLLDAILAMQAEGYQNVPRVVFLLGKDPGGVAYTLEGFVKPAYFQDDKYASCWFYADEELNPSRKPLIIGNFSSYNADDATRKQFWMKNIQWPSDMYDPDAMPWMDWNVVQKNHNGVMAVTVSQGGASSSEAYFDPNESYEARGWSPYNPLEHGTKEADVMAGTNFEFKWENAISQKSELNIVMVTGWNEWIVRKLAKGDPAAHGFDYGEYVDSFSMAYSRDAEMMKGGYGDNYYMQLVRNVRNFKGVTIDGTENVASNQSKTISIDDFAAWNEVSAKYLDLGIATVARNHTSVDRSIPYTDTSNRNDIDYVQMCNDGENLYVAVTAKEELTAYRTGDEGWMNLYISCGGTGWAGYDFVINRRPDLSAGTTSVEAFTGEGSATRSAGSAKFAVSGKTIVYAIPLSVLGADEQSVIELKASDNLQSFGDADDFYISGDCAPMGRLNYAYRLA